MPKYYPIMVDLNGQEVAVVGGGTVALRKVQILLQYGAKVTIIAPQICPQLQEHVTRGECTWICKEYDKSDIANSILVFSCTDQEEVNTKVSLDARDLKRFINVADDPEKCSFIVPSIMTRGDLTVAVSTSGSCPIVARQIRSEIEEQYGEEISAYLDLLKKWRSKVKASLNPQKRAQFWERVTGGQVRTLLADKRQSEAERMIEQCFQSLLD